MELSKIEEKIKTYIDDPDLSWIRKAHELSREAHRGQYRISGEPFVEHPLGVAYIMAELELDLTSIAAAILHDIIEDTGYSREDIAEEFNQEIALLVDGVTKLTRMDFKSREEQQAESLRKMFLAMSDDIRVVLIKLADRLHNMRTLGYMGEENSNLPVPILIWTYPACEPAEHKSPEFHGPSRSVFPLPYTQEFSCYAADQPVL